VGRRFLVFLFALALIAGFSTVSRSSTAPAGAAVAPARLVQSIFGVTTTDEIVLPAWTPKAGQLVLVGVVSQAWRDLNPVVRGNGLQFDVVRKVTNAQAVQSLTVFRAQGNATTGRITVGLPGNSGAVAVTAVRVSSAKLGGNGANAIDAVRSNRGPASTGPARTDGDDSDMKTSITTTAGDLVVAFGGHRLEMFRTPADQRAGVVNVARGSGGERIVASTWWDRAVAGDTVMGGDDALIGRAAGDDWAMLALTVRGSGVVVPPTSAAPPTSATPPPSVVPPATTTPPTTTSPPVPRPVACESAASSCRPYDPASPWNTPISPAATTHPKSATYINAIADNGLPLTADVDQYTIPVYTFDNTTPLRTVDMSGYFSSYDGGDSSRKGYGFGATITGIPVPDEAVQGVGSDGQIVIWNPQTGVEYSFWQFERNSAGQYIATNGYRYHTTAGYHGRFADGLAGRGAGTPYFAGLVRPWEIAQGRIDHALAFAYHSPSPEFVYPASKSDGASFGGVASVDLPEGSRLQLNPALTTSDLQALGLSPQAIVIAKALQTYGMYTIDNSGSSKIYLEDRRTANWPSSITRNLVAGIPWSEFRVIS
jgi:hypothetical protein